tara:strand:+ start:3232 stop:3894 length:663 start_codon:yes stop_codon:yes gene_type:complete
MKNIILQHWTGELGPLELASKANMEKYAKQCGAEYQLIEGNQFRSWLSPPCQKLIMLDERFDKYQDVLMVDLDMFVVKNVKENVFHVPGVGLNSKVQKDIFKAMCKSRKYRSVTDPNGPFWGGAFWKFNNEQRKQLRKFIVDDEMKVWKQNFVDEGIIHRLASQAGFKQIDVPEEWCWGNCFPGYEKAKMIHIRHKFKYVGPKVPKLEVFEALKKEGIFE